MVAYALTLGEETLVGVEPSTYSEAISDPNSPNWLVANEDIEILQKNGTWDLVKLPKGQKVLTYRWIYKQKEGIPESKLQDRRHTLLLNTAIK